MIMSAIKHLIIHWANFHARTASRITLVDNFKNDLLEQNSGNFVV